MFNAQAEYLFGYNRVEVLGSLVEVLVPELRREEHVRHRIAYRAAPRMVGAEGGMLVTARHKGGQVFTLVVKLAPMVVAAAGLYTVALCRRYAGGAEGGGS